MKKLPSLDLSGLPDWCNDSTWTRSLGLLRTNKVKQVSVELTQPPHGWQITGSVQGTLRLPYRSQAHLYLDDEGGISGWKGTCSCPVEVDCKHAMALTLAALAQSPSPSAPSAPSAPTLPNPAKPTKLVSDSAAVPTVKTLWAAPVHSLVERAPAQRPPSASPWQYWLEAWDRSSVVAEAVSTADQFVYLLSTDADPRSPVLRMRAALSRPRRSGGWLQPKPLRTQPLAGQSRWDQASPADQLVLQLLPALSAQQNPYAYRDAGFAARLDSAMAVLALQSAASTGRLMAEDGGGLLRWGEDQLLQWDWVETGASGGAGVKRGGAAALQGPGWQLQARLPSASAVLCHNQPLMYLDVAQGLCGLVQAPGLAPGQLRLLMGTPPLASAHLPIEPAVQSAKTAKSLSAAKAQSDPHLAPALVQRLGAAGVPLPPPLAALSAVQGVPPVALLHLALRRGVLPHTDALVAQLRFDYQGHVGWWEGQPQDVLLTDSGGGAPVRLRRDLVAEAQAVQQLAALGMQSEPESESESESESAPGSASGQWVLPPALLITQGLQWWADDFVALRAAGFAVTVERDAFAGWVQVPDGPDEGLVVAMTPQTEGGSEDGAQSPWFDLSLGLEIQGVRHNVLPWLPGLIAQAAQMPPDPETGKPRLPPFWHVPAPQGWGFVRLSTAALRPWMDALFDLVGERSMDFDASHLRLSRAQALRTQAALGDGVAWQGASALQALVQSLRQQQADGRLPQVAVPVGVQAQLRPYQQQGLNWLQFLRTHGLGGVLADDMGLGKTLQTLAHIQVEKDAGRLTRPALVIAPVSLLGNWQREAERFCPGLRCQVLRSAQQLEGAASLEAQDLVIAPYSLLQQERGRAHCLAQDWHLVVLDEAQTIKNASSQTAQAVGRLRAQQRLCLSGTPMENHLGELWSLFHFVMPGFLGSQTRFNAVFRQPIEKGGQGERMAQLRARVAPFMLRRSKSLVAQELPPKVETVMPVVLQGAQADLYETIRLGTERTVREALAGKGLARSQLTILDALLKLRQVCCDPRLVALEAAQAVTESAKLEQLMALLPEMLAEGRRVLVFSQFTRMLALIEAELKKADLPWVKLTGQSVRRDALIERFTSGEVPLFLISLKAGGVGLNLPQADTVIHMDPWWNPAAEAQATDRAHRIGQTRKLWVIKLVAQGTIEERILALQERKARLAADLYEGHATRQEPLFTEGDLASLLQPLPMPVVRA